MNSIVTPISPAAEPAAPLLYSDQHLIWLDMEMSGLDPETCRVLEVAVVITSPCLEVVEEGPVVVVHQPDEVLDAMDDWNKSTHGKSGLIDRVKASTLTEAAAEALLLEFLRPRIKAGASPLCGNTVHQDRRFMVRYLPQLEAFFHYRHVDVSTLKELARRWKPDVLKGFQKRSAHTALADVHESIDELRYYRSAFIGLTSE